MCEERREITAEVIRVVTDRLGDQHSPLSDVSSNLVVVEKMLVAGQDSRVRFESGRIALQ